VHISLSLDPPKVDQRRVELAKAHNTKTGAGVTREIQHVFMMTGADPNTEWLRGSLALDGLRA
jgi:alkyl hydroperoxide reductase subunit AhpF